MSRPCRALNVLLSEGCVVHPCLLALRWKLRGTTQAGYSIDFYSYVSWIQIAYHVPGRRRLLLQQSTVARLIVLRMLRFTRYAELEFASHPCNR